MALDEKQKTDLQEFIERMNNYKARHTELITVLVPSGFDINLITKQLESEKSTASNIKSTGTRKNVQEALESLIRITKGMKQTPKNGVALLAGNVSQTEGQDDFVTEVFEPPPPPDKTEALILTLLLSSSLTAVQPILPNC